MLLSSEILTSQVIVVKVWETNPLFTLPELLDCCFYVFQARAFSASSVQQQLVKVRTYRNVGRNCVGDLLRYVDHLPS